MSSFSSWNPFKVLELCRRTNSDCLVAPCCNGKMHQHFLEEESARAVSSEVVLEEESSRTRNGSNTSDSDVVLEEEEADKTGSKTLEREIVLEEEAEVDQHLLELDEKTKRKNRDVEEGESGLVEGEEECFNFYPRSKLFSSLLSR